MSIAIDFVFFLDQGPIIALPCQSLQCVEWLTRQLLSIDLVRLWHTQNSRLKCRFRCFLRWWGKAVTTRGRELREEEFLPFHKKINAHRCYYFFSIENVAGPGFLRPNSPLHPLHYSLMLAIKPTAIACTIHYLHFDQLHPTQKAIYSNALQYSCITGLSSVQSPAVLSIALNMPLASILW